MKNMLAFTPEPPAIFAAMTMKMYADRKGLAFEGATVTLSHHRHHEKDVENVVSGEGGKQLETIKRVISLSGSLTDDQRASVIAIADKCPVHRTLSGHLEIVTEIED